MTTRQKLIRGILGFSIYLLVNPLLLLLCAGNWTWPMAWLYIVLMLTSALASRLIVFFKNRDLLTERANFAEQEGAPSVDRTLVAVAALYAPMMMAIVTGLDHRFGWSPTVANSVPIFSAILLALGYGFAVWAMVVNPFFSAVVRLQEDRGQVVVTQGPYRWVRHPSYAGACLASLAFPLMLGSYWALVPGLLSIAALVLRTRLEDALLIEGLEGYRGYAEATRFRLIPGVW